MLLVSAENGACVSIMTNITYAFDTGGLLLNRKYKGFDGLCTNFQADGVLIL